MFDVSKLNPEQQEAVLLTTGPVMILAGAGTGKTRVITCRIAHMIASGIAPQHIFAVTFTNKAAKEMRERLKPMLPRGIKVPRMGTFHSVCLDILRKYSKEAGLEDKFSIAASSDQVDLVRRGLEEKNWQVLYQAEKVQAAISLAKNALLTPEKLREQGLPQAHVDSSIDLETLATAYELYERQLRLNRVIDFDDCILKAFLLLDRDLVVRERVQETMRYLLVDEFQDTNLAQLRILHLIAEHHRNLCVVGDDDQSIYSWRGAVTHNLTEFEELFPETKQIKLEQNYRCSNVILNAANAVIKNNTMRKDKTLWSASKITQAISLQEFENEIDEARWIAQKCYGLLGKGIPADQIAVLYRANNQARTVELAMREFNIRYKVYGGQSFFERKEIKDFLSYLRLVVHPEDRMSFWRAVNTPPRGLGLKSLEHIDELSQDRKCSPFQVITRERLALASRVQSITDQFAQDIQDIVTQLRETQDIENVCKTLIKSFKLEEHIKVSTNDPESAQRKLEALRRMPKFILDACQEQKQENPDFDIFEILDKLTMGEQDVGAEKNRENASVSLMTIHAAKGLEFQAVFVIGIEEGTIPHKNSALSEASVSEERRLFYVALTRAKEHLFLSYALSKSMGRDRMFKKPSRFLKELPEETLVRGEPVVQSNEEQKQAVKASFAKRLADFKSLKGARPAAET